MCFHCCNPSLSINVFPLDDYSLLTAPHCDSEPEAERAPGSRGKGGCAGHSHALKLAPLVLLEGHVLLVGAGQAVLKKQSRFSIQDGKGWASSVFVGDKYRIKHQLVTQRKLKSMQGRQVDIT